LETYTKNSIDDDDDVDDGRLLYNIFIHFFNITSGGLFFSIALVLFVPE
jgi:hypothetical protein